MLCIGECTIRGGPSLFGALGEQPPGHPTPRHFSVDTQNVIFIFILNFTISKHKKKHKNCNTVKLHSIKYKICK